MLEDFENDGKKLKEADLAITEPMKKGKSNGLKFGLMASNATSGNSKNPAKAIRTRNPLTFSDRIVNRIVLILYC